MRPERLQIPVGEVDHEAAEVFPGPLTEEAGQTLSQPRLGLLPRLVSCTVTLLQIVRGPRYSPSSDMMASLRSPIPVPAPE